jgi:hypothetical protein
VWKALHADYDIEKRFEALKAKVGGGLVSFGKGREMRR